MPKISEKYRFSPSESGLACSDGGYSPLAQPINKICIQAIPMNMELTFSIRLESMGILRLKLAE